MDVDATTGTAARPRLRALARVARSVGISVVAGAAAGALVGGAGSRLAMRVTAVVAGAGAQGVLTENGNRVGAFTAEGTGFLLVFGALFAGVPGGLAYAAVRPHLERLGRWKGLGFGLLLLASLGFVVVDAGNRDFRQFGPPALNAAMFALLYPLYGMAVAPVHDRLDRALPGVPRPRPLRVRHAAGYALWTAALLPAVVAAFTFGTSVVNAALGGEGGFGLGGVVFSALVLAAPAARVLARRRPGPARALLILPVAAGLVLTVRSVVRILGG